jgi:hypothetical protein
MTPRAGGSPNRRLPLLPCVLVLLAILELRTELRLLADHFTWTSLREMPRQHPLAVAVLLAAPWLLLRRY